MTQTNDTERLMAEFHDWWKSEMLRLPIPKGVERIMAEQLGWRCWLAAHERYGKDAPR